MIKITLIRKIKKKSSPLFVVIVCVTVGWLLKDLSFELFRSDSDKNTHSVDDLIDITYRHDMDYYKNTDFEQILFIDDIKDYTFKHYQEHSKKYLNECLNNPIRYGNRVLNI